MALSDEQLLDSISRIPFVDSVELALHDGRGMRLPTVREEYTRKRMAIRDGHSIRSADVIEVLAELMLIRGVQDHIRADNGLGFTAKAVRDWLGRAGAWTPYIEPGSPWENGYIESFNGKLRDELLEVRALTERYGADLQPVRPHSCLGYRPPAPETLLPADAVPVLVSAT